MNHVVDTTTVYDAAGNLMKDSHHSYSYDQNGNLLQVDAGATASYVYDALNQRVQVKVPAATPNTLEYTSDFKGRRITTWDANANFGIQGQAWLGSQPLAYRDTDGTTYFQPGDWVGTQRLLTNYAGSNVSVYRSNPFGDGYSASSTDHNRQHYAELDHDAESGTDHAQFRQYNTNLGQWMSLDPYRGSYDFNNPQSYNRYTYAMNNPLSFVDPSGLVCQLVFLPAYSIDAGGDTVQGAADYMTFCDGNEGFTLVGGGGGGGGGGDSSAPINPPPCAPSGSAPAPTVYQQRGQQANNMTNAYDPYGMSSAAGAMYNAQNLYQFKRGGPLDAQVRYGGSTAYANYGFGVYLSAAGWTLQQTLSAANDYAAARSSYPNHPSMDPNYPSTPASNVANITAGYNAQQSGTLCHK